MSLLLSCMRRYFFSFHRTLFLLGSRYVHEPCSESAALYEVFVDVLGIQAAQLTTNCSLQKSYYKRRGETPNFRNLLPLPMTSKHGLQPLLMILPYTRFTSFCHSSENRARKRIFSEKLGCYNKMQISLKIRHQTI